MTTVFGAAIPCRRAERFGVFAHDAAFQGLPRAYDVTDHDQAGRDADAHLERLARAACSPLR
jgi:hypothetical protein